MSKPTPIFLLFKLIKTMQTIVELKITDEYAKELKNKFPELKKLTNKQIMTTIVEDYLGDFSVFGAKYYCENDIKELFK